MNRSRQILHLLLAFMVITSIVVMTGHNYSHVPSEISTCELCIHHGNSNSAVETETHTVFLVPPADSFVQNHQPVLAQNIDYFHQPSRAPPRST